MPVNKSRRRALIIQPGAVGDVILTLPLLQFLLAERNIDQVDMIGHIERLQYLQPGTLLGEAISLESVATHRLFENSNDFESNDSDRLVELLQPYELVISFLSDKSGDFEKNLTRIANRSCGCDVAILQLWPEADTNDHVSTFFIRQFVQQMPDMDLNLRQTYLEPPLIQKSDSCQKKGLEQLERLGLTQKDSVIILHPGSGATEKCWPIQNYSQLVQQIRQNNRTPLFLLGPVEKEKNMETLKPLINDNLVLSDLKLDEVRAILNCASGYVGNDSGITHLAASQLPTVAIFGPTNPQHWRPLGKNVSICHSPTPGQWPNNNQIFSTLQQTLKKT